MAGDDPAWMARVERGNTAIIVEVEYAPDDVDDAVKFLSVISGMGAEILSVEAM